MIHQQGRVITRNFKRWRLTSKLKVYKESSFGQESFDDYTPKTYIPTLNDDLFGNAFND